MTRNNIAFIIGFALMSLLILTGCGERASCWNDIKGRYTSCEDMRGDEIERRIDRREGAR